MRIEREEGEEDEEAMRAKGGLDDRASRDR